MGLCVDLWMDLVPVLATPARCHIPSRARVGIRYAVLLECGSQPSELDLNSDLDLDLDPALDP